MHREPMQVSPSLTILPRTYQFTVTDEPDGDYLKYLQRRLQAPITSSTARTATGANESRLDISLDNPDSDVVAGIAAYTAGESLVIELIWVHDALRGQGIGRHLIQMAEDAALVRGCTTVYITYASCTGFYQKLGYSVTAKLTHFPMGSTFYRLQKALAQAQMAPAPASEPETPESACCHRESCSRTACGKIAN